FSWRAASEQFLAHLRPLPAAQAADAQAPQPSTATGA
ncbi:glycosyltransferase family 1 protein, partial [Ralstonia pseudosolanacearum]